MMGKGNVFKVANKRSEIYGSMLCLRMGLGMTAMFIFRVKKMFLKVLRRRCHGSYYLKSWQGQGGKKGEKTEKLKETQQYDVLAFYPQEFSGAFKCARPLEFY